MYQVPGMDIVFACIMCALMIAVAYVYGRTRKVEEFNEAIKGFIEDRNWLCKDYRELEESFVSERRRWDHEMDMLAITWQHEAQNTKAELAKRHREAMKKYRTKCDRQVVAHMEKYVAMQQPAQHDSKCDVSAFMSK